MVTVQVTLDDETYESLKANAARVGQPIETLLAALAAREWRDAATVTDEFIADVKAMVDEYRPVLRRLAQ